MGHAGRFLDRRGLAQRLGLIKLLEAGIAIGMKDAAEGLEVRAWMIAFAVRAVEVAHRRRCLIGTGTAIADIDPHARFWFCHGPAPARKRMCRRRAAGRQQTYGRATRRSAAPDVLCRSSPSRASRRQGNNRRGLIPCRRATAEDVHVRPTGLSHDRLLLRLAPSPERPPRPSNSVGQNCLQT
jgi:hypothetical protein